MRRRPASRVLILRVDGPMVFANVDAILETLSVELAAGGYRRVVLDLEAVYEVDTTAVADLQRFVEDHGDALPADGSCFPTVRAAVGGSVSPR